MTIDLVARIGGFERGLDQAERKASRTASQIAREQKKRAMEVEAAWKNAGITVGAGFTAAAAGLAVWLRSSVSAIDQFNDLKDATGSSIENISALDSIARQTGGTFEQVTSTLTKFNAVLKDADPTKGAGAVLRALNLDIEELKRLDPAEALRQTAVALQGYADDGAKARAVQELFGKSVREVAPFLKDLAEAGKLQSTVSTEAAEEIDKFNKEMAKAKASADDLARSLSINLITELNTVIDRFKAGRAEGKGFFELGWERYKENMRGVYEDLGLLEKRAEKLKITPTFSADDQSQAEMQRLLRQAQLPSLVVPPDAKNSRKPRGNNEAERAAKEAQSYLENLQKQLQATENLSVAETVLADIRAGRLKLAGGVTEEALIGVAKQIDAARELTKTMEEQKRAMEAIEQMQAAMDSQALAEVDALMQGNQALRDEIELLGLEAPERAKVEQARLNSTIALKEEELQMLRNAGASATQITALEREIKLLQQRSVLLGQKGQRVAEVEAANEAKKFADELNTDLKRAISDAFRDSENPLKAFGDSIFNTVSARLSAALSEQLASGLLDMLGLGAKSGTGGGWAGLISSFLGAPGRAAGGAVLPGGLYEINENGPEVLAMGGRQYLMMGDRSGNVIPNGGGGRPVHFEQHIHVQGQVDNRTAAQIGRQASRALRESQRWT